MVDALLSASSSSGATRQLADDSAVNGGICGDPTAFLGVGNSHCLHANLGTAVFLLGVIVVVSIGVDRLIRVTRRSVRCPQLRKIVDRIFQEVMIMGFISMVIFTLNTSGALHRMNFAVDALSAAAQLHFYEFFHYIVFLTMIYFILIVLLLLFIGTVVPKLIWHKPRQRTLDIGDSDSDSVAVASSDPNDDNDNDNNDNDTWDGRGGDSDGADGVHRSPDTVDESFVRHHATRVSALRRPKSGMDLVHGSRAYSLLLERYEREGWSFRFNVLKQWHLWKSFEILAYNICQNRSGYIYKNPDEMERLFGVPKASSQRTTLLRPAPPCAPMTYARYHVLCMRNLLVHITDLHFSALLILLVISVLPSLYPAYDHWIFVGVGGSLLLANVVIFFKVLTILRGTVDDRLRVITMRDINARLAPQPHDIGGEDETRRHLRAKPKPTLKAVALAVRAVLRMQMSALCHRQLHHHDDRFWFHSPKLLLRMFQFATISQAFYLVWLSLVEAPTIAQKPEALYLLPIMVLLPFVALCVITPMTMPSLVLVMSLTGIFVDLNTEPSRLGTGTLAPHDAAKVQIRLMRRSFLKSHYTDTDDATHGGRSPVSCAPAGDLDAGLGSPTNVFLRIYDSPTVAAAHTGLASDVASPTNSSSQRGSFASGAGGSIGRTGASIGRSGLGATSSVGRSSRDDVAYSPRRAFNLAAFQAHANPSSLGTVSFVSPRGQAAFGESVSANWSQAAVEGVGNGVAKKSTPAEASGGEHASNNQTDPLVPLNPAAESLKRFCSKYGGYPEC